MATVFFPRQILQHLANSQTQACGGTVREVLEDFFANYPEARGQVLDERSSLRKHFVIFVDGEVIADRMHLSDRVGEASSIHVFQAMSGG